MTMIFNTFVFYSFFNQINSRVINNNLNIFHRIFDNWILLAVISVEILIQFLIVQYGGLFFKCNKEGLTLSQWEWCLGLLQLHLWLILYLNSLELKYCALLIGVNYLAAQANIMK